MKVKLQESEKLHLVWSEGAGGKKIHVMSKFKREYWALMADSDFAPACGSGVNSAGQTWKRASRHGLLLAEVVESDRVCSKCLKSEYVVEVAA
jgi:hypothetical protein